MKDAVEETFCNVFTIMVRDDNRIPIECRIRTRNLICRSTRNMFVHMFSTRHVCPLADFDTGFLVIFTISQFTEFRAVPPLLTIVAFDCRLLLTCAKNKLFFQLNLMKLVVPEKRGSRRDIIIITTTAFLVSGDCLLVLFFFRFH